MRLLHLHSDYPDGLNPDCTPAVKLLLDASSAHTHIVFVIHRTALPWRTLCIETGPGVYSIYYWGLPYGIALSLSLYLATKALLKLIRDQHIDADLLHGHKLAIDGSLTAALAKQLTLPYILSVRGGTDMRVLKHKRSMRLRCKKVLEEAKHIFWVSSWAKRPMQQLLKTTGNHNDSLLPNLCEMVPLNTTTPTLSRTKFVTVFRFKQYKRKGILPLIEAIGRLKQFYPDICLDIYGTGSAKQVQIVQDKINEMALGQSIKIKGRIDNHLLQQELQSYSAFLLPSENESFGMVYVEALFSGLPILYHADTGIDGYLTDIDIGVKVQSQRVAELAKAIESLIINHDIYQARIQAALEKKELDIFTKQTVVTHYQNLIDSISSS